ncbi:11358_t:CDS:2, partial [Acaulospora colombiana]
SRKLRSSHFLSHPSLRSHYITRTSSLNATLKSSSTMAAQAPSTTHESSSQIIFRISSNASRESFRVYGSGAGTKNSHSDWYIVTTAKDLHVIKEPILAPVSTIPAQKIAEKVTESSTNQVNLVTSHTAQHSQGQNINHSDLVVYRNGSRNRRRSIVSDDMTDSSASTTELKIDLPVDEHSHQHAQPTPIDSSVKHAPKIIIAQRNDSQAEVPHVANEPNEPTNNIDFLVRLYQLLPRLPSQAVVPSAHDLRPSSLRRSCTVPAHFSGVCHLDRDKPAGLVSPGQISTDERESITSTLLQMLIESKDPNEPYLMDESLPPPSIIVSPPTGSTLSLQRKSEIFY